VVYTGPMTNTTYPWAMAQHLVFTWPGAPYTDRILTDCVWIMRVRAMNQGRK